MNKESSLVSTLASLKFTSSTPVHKNSVNYLKFGRCVKEFKAKLVESLDSGEFSDSFLKNVADFFYDIKACDRSTSYKLSRNFESRPNIISNQLRGGVLWTYYNNPSLNRRRRKIISSSCRVAIRQSISEFLNLKENVTNISKFDSILKNLKVVGDCYRVPVEAKTRLEQSILESSEVFNLALECFPLLLQMCSAFCSLKIDNENIARAILEVYCQMLQKDDTLTLSEVSSICRKLYKWKVSRIDKTVRSIEVFRELLESSNYDFLANPPTTVKVFTSAVRLPRSEPSLNLCYLILNKSSLLVDFCNNSDLVLFFNAIAHFKRSYPGVDLRDLDPLIDNLETYVEFEKSEWNKSDLNTIYRSCTILKDSLKVTRLLELCKSQMVTSSNKY